MYLAIGSTAILRLRDVIGIFDLDNTTVSRRTRILLAKMQGEGRVRDACEPGELPKSMILCANGGETLLYLSQYTPRTLARRVSSGFVGSLPSIPDIGIDGAFAKDTRNPTERTVMK